MKAVFVPIVLAAAVTAACTSTPPRSEAPPAPPPVSTVRAAMTDEPSWFEAGGVVSAKTTALVASRVMAPIVDVHVRAGDAVKRGAVLVTLDSRDVRAGKARADAAAIAADDAVRAAQGDLEAADSALRLARITHERMAALHERRSATTQELDQAVAALAAAEAQKASAQARLGGAAAGRDAARAASDAASVAATYATLAAPFDGIVTERNADPGSMAAPGVPLLTVEDPSAFRLEVRVDEARAGGLAVGQNASVQLDGTQSDAAIDGRIVEIARIDPSSHSFLVKIDLPRTAGVRGGAFGRARFAGAPRRALTIPNSAVTRRGQLTFVFLVDGSGRATLRPVSLADASGDRVEVLAGIRDGDSVVIAPHAALADGATVRVANGARP